MELLGRRRMLDGTVLNISPIKRGERQRWQPVGLIDNSLVKNIMVTIAYVPIACACISGVRMEYGLYV